MKKRKKTRRKRGENKWVKELLQRERKISLQHTLYAEDAVSIHITAKKDIVQVVDLVDQQN
jgi:hypothetical protein